MANRPQAAELLELCEDTIAEYGTRDSGFTELEKYYFLDLDKRDKEAEEEGIEVVRLPYGTSAVDLVQDLLGDAELSISVPATAVGPEAKKLADSAEKFLLSVLEQSEKAQKQGLLSRAAWLVAMRGCLAGRVLAIQDWLTQDEKGDWQAGQRAPLLLQLRDPLFVYPAFSLDGLAYVVEQRTRKVRDLRNSLGDDVLPGKKLADEVEWTEYWDQEWFCYWADGEVITLGEGAGPWPHRYGGIPYAFEFARQTGKTDPDKRVRPLLKAVQSVIDRLALLDSAEATFIMNYNGDALMVYAEDQNRQIDLRSGAVNYLEPTDRVDWLRASRQPLEITQAQNKYSSQLQKGTFPDSVFGMDPGRVMAGYAINLLNQSGQVRIRPLIGCIERFLGGLFENVLMITEHYLTDLVGGAIPFYLTGDREDEEGSRYRSREQGKLDAKRFGGWYEVEASLGEVMPADEQANLMLALRSREMGPDGRPLLSWETSVERFGLTTSPGDERERIDREMALSDPQVVALTRTLYAAQIVQELKEELLKLDIDPEMVLAQLTQPSAPSPEQPAELAQLPPEVLAAQMQGQFMPQPMGAMEPGPMEVPPPTVRERPRF